MPFLAVEPFDIFRNGGIFLLLLVPLVVIHEFGHFLAAKAFGIKVLEFGIGFPPKAVTYLRKGETEYTLNWLPIGGFVRLLGEEDPSDPRSLAAQSAWKRLTVIYAGVVMNLILAVVLLAVGYMVPREVDFTRAQVTSVSEDSPAAEARITGPMQDGSEPVQGLQPGDIVLEVEGRDVRNTSEMIYANRLNLLEAEVYARWHPPAGQGPTGITVGAPTICNDVDDNGDPINCQLLYPFTETDSFWPWEAFPKGVASLKDSLVLTYNEIRVRWGGGGGGAATSDEPAFTGPVGIASQTGELIDEAGWRPIIELSALLSLNLAIFNALPIPMLDGGRAAIVFVEIVRRGKRIAPEREALIHLTGFALLMAGVLIVTFFDIQRLVS
jgi:regulator of sigma E protease